MFEILTHLILTILTGGFWLVVLFIKMCVNNS